MSQHCQNLQKPHLPALLEILWPLKKPHSTSETECIVRGADKGGEMEDNWFSVLVIPMVRRILTSSPLFSKFLSDSWLVVLLKSPNPDFTMRGDSSYWDPQPPPSQPPADGFPHWLSHQDVNSKPFWMIIDLRFLLVSVLSPFLVSWNLSQGHVCWLLITSGTPAVMFRLKSIFSLTVENICQASFSWELFLTPSDLYVLNCNNSNNAALFLWHHIWLVVVLKTHFWSHWGFKKSPRNFRDNHLSLFRWPREILAATQLSD